LTGGNETLWLIIAGAPILFALWFVIFMRWTRGIELLLLYMPFAGAVTLWLAPNPAPLLFKDFMFVIPLYLAVAVINPQALRHATIPPVLTALAATFAIIVLLQLFNPRLPKLMVGLIGAKVWLFYLPMLYVGAAALRQPGGLVRILRLMTVVSVVPFVVGLTQYALANTMGYSEAIELFYGAAAQGATQGYSQFDFGAALYRIPSTFTFVAQYSGYCLAMIAVTYALTRLDPNRHWRVFARGVFALAIVAGLLSGARGNFVFIPFLLALIYVLDARITGGVAALVLLPAFLLAVLWFAGYDPLEIFGATQTLMGDYSAGLVLPSLTESVQKFPMGLGTGMNTGPARYVLSPAELSAISAFGYESYYAKAVVELGIPGFFVVLALFAAVIFYGFKAHLAVRDRRLQSCSAALLAFLALISVHGLKGWLIDMDPVNVLFWLFAGMLLKLPVLASQGAARPAASSLAARLRRGGGSIRWSSRARPPA
jgi:hypothetical protein